MVISFNRVFATIACLMKPLEYDFGKCINGVLKYLGFDKNTNIYIQTGMETL